jgi:hypothetical protein
VNAPARLESSSKLLTHDQAAAHIHVCPKTLRSLRQRGLIPYVAITARKKLYRPEDLDAFLASQVRVEVYQPTARRRGSKRLSERANVVSFTARREERLAARGR